LVRGSKLDFLKFAKPAFALSWMLILIGIAYGFYRGKQVFGVEFRGGDQLIVGFAQPVGVDEVRKTVEEMKIGDAILGYNTDPANGRKTLGVTTEVGTGTKVLEEIQKKFPDAKFERLALDQVGAVVGQEIQKSAVISVLLAMFGILVYVAFRYEFSINDTIVIFDRIREDLKLGVRGTFAEVINKALNQTLSRTIITSGTVFIATVALYLFGGGAINDFALAFIFGILTGTYSSIYIASALVLWWNKGQRPMLGAGVEIQPLEPQPAKA
jgi:SecD/SecF fusion protein